MPVAYCTMVARQAPPSLTRLRATATICEGGLSVPLEARSVQRTTYMKASEECQSSLGASQLLNPAGGGCVSFPCGRSPSVSRLVRLSRRYQAPMLPRHQPA